ncbi:MAG: transposase [Planctomycetota bacterium]|jgi:REP element-mobilizing transposase RayT
MTTARKTVVSDRSEGVYHCISRCVRQAYLCGEDNLTGKNFNYRKKWIKGRLEELSGIFGIDICSYAVMSNHLHLVLRNRPDVWRKWSDDEVAKRWWKLFPRRRSKDGSAARPNAKEIEFIKKDKKRFKELRLRLGQISWFMRCLNEYIARKANKEDCCTGRFWEGRFKCQALLDEAAELTCMAYVDLNPVRAEIAEMPEKSDFTSARDRIDSKVAKERVNRLRGRVLNHIQLEKVNKEKKKISKDKWLNPIGITKYSDKNRRKGILSITLNEYLELLDWTGRSIKSGKRGAIPDNIKPILSRLDIDVNRWVDTVLSFGKLFYRVAGKLKSIVKKAKKAKQVFFKGLKASQIAFGSP